MNKTTLISLVGSLAHSKGDSDTQDDAYYRTLDILARASSPFVDQADVNLVASTTEYSLSTNAAKILALFVKPNNVAGTEYRLVREVGLRELELYDKDWRTTQAAEDAPIAYTIVDLAGTTVTDWTKIRLFPTPDTSVTNGIAYFYADRNEATNIYDFIALPIVFNILWKEFEYPSDHQDMEFAKLCSDIAQFLRAFVMI